MAAIKYELLKNCCHLQAKHLPTFHFIHPAHKDCN